MSFNSKNEEPEAVSETACDFPLMKLLGQYAKEGRVNETTKVDEFEKKEENADEDKKGNDLDSVSLQEIGESGLKSLLDEAYSYKSPKDRVGKSSLFQELLNEVEENDGSKKVVDRSKEFMGGGLKTSVAAIENGHDSASDKLLLNNILGSCGDKEKKKKKKQKRDCSSSNNGSRKSKFNHLLNINHGGAAVAGGVGGGGSPQITPYNGGNGGNDGSGGTHFHSSSRSLSRAPQSSLSTRFGATKATAFLTSSSSIDVPTVTTYNKQPIMTPALVPSGQQPPSGESCLSEAAEKTNCSVDRKASTVDDREIEMKVLGKTAFDDSVHNYMTHASLEIGNVAQAKDKAAEDSSACLSLVESSRILFPSQSCTALTNVNVDTPIISPVAHFNGLLQEKVEIDSLITNNGGGAAGNCRSNCRNLGARREPQIGSTLGDGGLVGRGLETVESEVEKRKIKNKKEAARRQESVSGSANRSAGWTRLDLGVDDANSVGTVGTMGTVGDMNAQNGTVADSSVNESHSEFGYPHWRIPLFVTVTDLPSHRTRNTIKDSADNPRRLYDDSNAAFSHNYTFMSTTPTNKDRLESGSDRKLKPRKPKKSPQASILSENIEGYCGDKSISYLLEYIESTNGGNGNANAKNGGNVKSKTTGGLSKSSAADKHRGRASTDDDIRQPKKATVKAKERLKKSTSLEDLRHVKSGGASSAAGANGGKAGKQSEDDGNFASAARTSAGAQEATPMAVDYQLLAEERVYLDSLLLDDDNYTEESEFHLVTKKQRKKKRRSESRTLHQSKNGARGGGCGYYEASAVGLGAAYKRTSRSSENRHRSRRKSVSSVVPSDRISDTDSIHSLPVSSTTPKCKVKKKSTSSGCTPQASYADIAKSPQLGGAGGGGSGPDSKWHPGFANSSSSSSSSSSASCTQAAVCSYSSACSANAADHDTPQLVPEGAEQVDVDGNCDRLSLTYSCNDSNNATPVNSADQTRSYSSSGAGNDRSDHSSYNSCNSSSASSATSANSSRSINESSASVGQQAKNCVDDLTNVDVTLKCAGKTSRKVESEENVDGAGNASRRSKKKRNVGEGADAAPENGKDEVFVEYTLKCSTPATSTTSCNSAVTTRSRKTQNCAELTSSTSASAGDVSVERTVVLKAASKNVHSVEAKRGADCKLAGCASPQTDARLLVLPDAEDSHLCVQFDVHDQVTADCAADETNEADGSSAATDSGATSPSSSPVAATSKVPTDNSEPNKRTETSIQRVNSEKSGKYNVNEVINFVHKSWNEVMKTLSSAKVTDAHNKVRYYSAK